MIQTIPLNPIGILNHVPRQHCCPSGSIVPQVLSFFHARVVAQLNSTLLIHHHLPPADSRAFGSSSTLDWGSGCSSAASETSHGTIIALHSSWNPLHRVKANRSKYVWESYARVVVVSEAVGRSEAQKVNIQQCCSECVCFPQIFRLYQKRPERGRGKEGLTFSRCDDGNLR